MDAAEIVGIVEADATNRQDFERMLELVSEDGVFEGTTPPDGLRIAIGNLRHHVTAVRSSPATRSPVKPPWRTSSMKGS